MSKFGPTHFDDHERDHFLGFHRRLIGYDNGHWVTFRVTLVAPSPERPHGYQLLEDFFTEVDTILNKEGVS